MQTIYLIRHGETEWNREKRFQGHSDSALSELGRRQAELVGLRLKDEPLSAIWSSDLSRAADTAAAIAAHHSVTVQTTTALREQSHGKWEGLNDKEIRAAGYGDLYDAYRLDSANNHPPEGETLQAVYRRAGKIFREIAGQQSEGVTVLVGHTGSLRAILCHVLASGTVGMRRVVLDNTSVSLVEGVDGRLRVRLMNDISHLFVHPGR
jgi:probable phosphoglycerate mutase/uncharacterized phosphatase